MIAQARVCITRVPMHDCAYARMYYASKRNNVVCVCISIRVLRPTQDRMNFSRFRRPVFRSALSGSATAIHGHHGRDIEDATFFVLE